MSHQLIREMIAQSIALKQDFFETHLDAIMAAADQIAACLIAGHKLMLFGNGGSAADAQHLAAEFINRFRIERPPLAALALSTDSSILTSIGNDYDFNQIFEKQIRALGQKGDIAWGISTSGNSPNVLSALGAAREMGIITMGFGGGSGGRMVDLCDRLFIVPSTVTARIQEVHITLGHILCELTDRGLFPGSFGEPS